ncbi:hypothetical protein [Angustibacter sp. Root456]|uniref:hypothetical protein n=1 Tax=Angustibacter sp. Root456 TaxID=1736539 RepID=UPI0006F70B89|nr:hypothetical protein [Angustibacter sp. Root456]KQX66010.1 hypothetical protein ASD06_06340 [Angustibacter sp. Root456]
MVLTSTRFVLAVGALALTLTACGVESSPGVRPAAGVTGSRPAQALLVAASDLPEGFRDSGGQSPGYAQQVCGVDLEPSPPVQTADARFSQGPLGPFVEQRVRVYDDDSAAAMMARLRRALAACDHYDLTASATAPAASIDVEPLRLPALGEESLAWRQTPRTSLPVTTDVVLIRTGRTVVLVTSYALKQAPDGDTARVAAQAAAKRLSA